jgi:hypothetical protein
MSAVMDARELAYEELDAEERIVEALAARFDVEELGWLVDALTLGRERYEPYDFPHETVTDLLGLVGRAVELRHDL